MQLVQDRSDERLAIGRVARGGEVTAAEEHRLGTLGRFGLPTHASRHELGEASLDAAADLAEQTEESRVAGMGERFLFAKQRINPIFKHVADIDAEGAHPVGARDAVEFKPTSKPLPHGAIGADPARVIAASNLKAAATAPPVDPATLGDIRARLGQRPVWIASSTHPGEEDTVLAAHAGLLKTRPDLCLVLIPRHPDRGDAVAALVRGSGLTCARRAAGEVPDPATQVYLADTLGETGTWYALSPLVFLGATLVPKGGHNPFEPAMAGCAIAAGPHRVNAADAYAGLERAGALASITDAASLAGQVARWLDDPQALDSARTAARAHVATLDAALDDLAARLCTALHLDPADA